MPCLQKFLTQPKAEFDDMSMDVLTNANTDAANRRLTDVDTKICHGLLHCCAAQEFICVVDRMGAGTNRAGQARRGDCLHASRATPHHRDATREWCTARARVDQSVLGKFNSGFLHFAIWQEPDQRFVVKIDHLYAVAPRVAKIAPERWFEFQVVLAGN